MNKKYFAKYLPVEGGEIKEDDMFHNGTGVGPNYGYKIQPTDKLVKLFLCSRDNEQPLGLVSESAKWVKENDEFDDSQIELRYLELNITGRIKQMATIKKEWYDKLVQNDPQLAKNYQPVYRIKCPCCEDFK